MHHDSPVALVAGDRKLGIAGQTIDRNHLGGGWPDANRNAVDPGSVLHVDTRCASIRFHLCWFVSTFRDFASSYLLLSYRQGRRNGGVGR